ncbi:MAG TPA: O-antigen polymerase [Bryobacteraceae bacterium]|nr:O-antigen polymerase [Bryobacteraceae bacterium]
MTLAAGIFLALLAAVNFRVRRSWFYPPALFSVWWAVLLIVLWLSGDVFYPLSLKTLAIYILGAMAFTLGGLLRLLSHPSDTPAPALTETQNRAAGRFLILSAVVLVVAFPFYWQRLQELRAASVYSDFWRAVRQQTSSDVPDENPLGSFKYVLGVASFMAMVAVYQNDGSRKARIRTALILAITLLYHLLTAARLGALSTLIGVLVVSRIRSGRIHWKSWCVGAVLLAVVFAVPAVLLNKGGDPLKSLDENVSGVLESLRHYTVSGLVAFNDVVDDPNVLPRWLSFRFFFAVGHNFGLDVNVPPLILPFAPTPALTNIYTIYASYLADFGLIGVAVLMCFHGFVVTMLYQAARRGRPEAVILFGLAVSTLALSAAADGFLIGLSYWIQATLCTLVVYRWPLLARSKGDKRATTAVVEMAGA